MKNEKNSSVKGSLRVVWCHLVVRNITEKNIYWHFNDLFKQRNINLFISISDHLPPFSYTLEGSFFAQLPNIRDFLAYSRSPHVLSARQASASKTWLVADYVRLSPSCWGCRHCTSQFWAPQPAQRPGSSPQAFPRWNCWWIPLRSLPVPSHAAVLLEPLQARTNTLQVQEKKKHCMTKPWSH